MLLKADVFSQTLHNLQIAMNLSVDEYDLAEYNNQLHKIINEGRNFLGDLISQCKTLEEAKLLLSHDYLLNHYALQYETTEWAYPRLDEACLSKHKELVTHDFSQRIFRENWLKSTKLKNVKSGVMKKIITGCILCPLYILFYLFGYLPMKSFGSLDCNGNLKFEAKFKQFPVLSDLFFHFSAPVNRCISDFSSHLLFILFILLTMINPNDEEKVTNPMIGIEIILSIFDQIILGAMVIQIYYLILGKPTLLKSFCHINILEVQNKIKDKFFKVTYTLNEK